MWTHLADRAPVCGSELKWRTVPHTDLRVLGPPQLQIYPRAKRILGAQVTVAHNVCVATVTHSSCSKRRSQRKETDQLHSQKTVAQQTFAFNQGQSFCLKLIGLKNVLRRLERQMQTEGTFLQSQSHPKRNVFASSVRRISTRLNPDPSRIEVNKNPRIASVFFARNLSASVS